jgi:two-component system LytT family response regulator
MKIKALIIDDEIEVSDTIAMFIEKYGSRDIKVVGQASNIKDAVKIYKAKGPEIIFLDIQLQNETGFDFIKTIKNPNQIIVMITAHAEYALKAYQSNVNAYLTKPISPLRFTETINRITRLAKLQKKSSGKLIIKDADKESHIIDASKVIKLKSIGKGITEIHTNKEIIISNRSIGKVQENLDQTTFVRINWGITINSAYIVKIDFKNNIVYLKDDSKETISFRRKKDLKDFINK